MDRMEKLRHAYQGWSTSLGSDPSVWLTLMADDVIIRSIADGAPGLGFSAPRNGIVEARRYFEDEARDWEMISFTVDDLFGAGDRAVMIGHCTWRFRSTGKAVTSPTAHVWRFRGDALVELIEFFDTARALAATYPDGCPSPQRP